MTNLVKLPDLHFRGKTIWVWKYFWTTSNETPKCTIPMMNLMQK